MLPEIVHYRGLHSPQYCVRAHFMGSVGVLGFVLYGFVFQPPAEELFSPQREECNMSYTRLYFVYLCTRYTMILPMNSLLTGAKIMLKSWDGERAQSLISRSRMEMEMLSLGI